MTPICKWSGWDVPWIWIYLMAESICLKIMFKNIITVYTHLLYLFYLWMTYFKYFFTVQWADVLMAKIWSPEPNSVHPNPYKSHQSKCQLRVCGRQSSGPRVHSPKRVKAQKERERGIKNFSILTRISQKRKGEKKKG